jgi:hypothetical protein
VDEVVQKQLTEVLVRNIISGSFRAGVFSLVVGTAAQLQAITINLGDPGSSPADAASNFIKEEGGVLTTDLPGVFITPVASAPGTEEWFITFSPLVWASIDLPGQLGEPASEPGTVNALALVPAISSTVSWTSDVAPGAGFTTDPSGSSYSWITQSGATVSVTLEDLSDGAPPSAVPDFTPSLATIGLLLLGVTGAEQLRRKGLSR